MPGKAFAAVLAACVLAWMPMPCLAFTSIIPQPEPLRIPFMPNQAILVAAGLAQVDRAAVRAAQCDSEPLRFVIWHEASVAPALLAERGATLRKRLRALGIEHATYKERTLENHRQGSRLGADELMVEVLGSEGSDYCFSPNGPLMARWVEQMGLELAVAPHAMPTLWRLMSPQVRRDDLALLLARAALCADSEMDSNLPCIRQAAVVWWLVERVAKRGSAEARQDWLRMMWEAGSDEDMARFDEVVRAVPLTAYEKSGLVQRLAQGMQPWPTVERRLLEPGVMQEIGKQPLWTSEGGSSRTDFLFAALKRREYESLDRLLDAGGEMSACYVSDALVYATWNRQDYSLVKPAWARLARGLRPRFERKHPKCDVTRNLLQLAACGTSAPERWTEELPDDRVIWRTFIDAGFVPDEDAIRVALAQPMDEMWGECRLERIEGVPLAELPFRRVSPAVGSP